VGWVDLTAFAATFRRRRSLTGVEPSRHNGLAQLHERYYPELVRLAFALTGDWSLGGNWARRPSSGRTRGT